ncbi:predicted protein [Naegleria gruberi]|uniref:Predicted protein n=1 Tax=Naegleria gruberi TaxID=5762 RepID=D2VC06_NAEGR|nr:uncharacterized protein NAEGRDRAFT_66402 [Naegleria gruberi]EFC45571.1 predicted protein [Naegleria gruberi]|eukprot:XP_002678315.1 predicted protein [Naegleria gruberi strain NEG-M]
MILTIISMLSLSIACFYSSILVAYRGNEVYFHITKSNIELNQLTSLMKIMVEYKFIVSENFVKKTNSSLINLLTSLQDISLDVQRINQLGYFPSDLSLIDYAYHIIYTIDGHVQFFLRRYNYWGIGDEETYSNVMSLTNDTLILYEMVLQLGDKYIGAKDDYINGLSIAGLVLTLILLIFMIPLSFSITFKTLMNNEKLIEKLKRVDAKGVKETILDSHFGPQFKEYCKQNRELRYFLFLERSIQFTEYCENIYNLDHNTELFLEDPNDIPNIENEIDKWQSKKCEIIFEIKTEFLSSKGEHFLGEKQIGGKKEIQKVKLEFKSNPMNLSDNLLDEIESNISIHLYSTFKSFQSKQKQKRSFYNISIQQ